MNKTFICLANSKKYGGRCLAGIEVARDENGKLQVQRDHEGQPKWVRPVSRSDFGAVPNEQARHLKLCDLVSFEQEGFCPVQCAQTENVYYKGKVFEKTGFLNLKQQNINLLIDQRPTLLNNYERSVSVKELAEMDHSITLIRTDTPSVQLHEKGMTQLRMSFQYEGHQYDLPITDYDFYLEWIDNQHLLADANQVYLCISLAKEMEGRLHKLVAGILYV